MKKLNERYFTIAVYALAVIAFLFLFGFLCFNLSPIFNGIVGAFQKLSAVVYAIVIALVLLPLVRLTETFFSWVFRKCTKHKDRLVRCFSLIVSYLLIILLLAAILLSTIPSFVGAGKNVQKLMTRAVPMLRPFLGDDIVVYAADSAYVGGLVGRNTGSISQSYAAESISSAAITQVFAGGLSGLSSGSVKSTFAIDNITARSAQTANAGGLFGKTELSSVTDQPSPPSSDEPATPAEQNYRYSGQLIAVEAPTATEQKDGETLLRTSFQSSDFISDVLHWSVKTEETPDGFWLFEGETFPKIAFMEDEDTSVSVWKGNVSPFSFGTGTENDPYLIRNAEELAFLSEYVNSGADCTGEYFLLCKDISLFGHEWDPIGKAPETPFRGIFLANGHIVSDLVSPAECDAFALFGYNEGRISDLTVSNIQINVAQTENLVAGGITAFNSGEVSFCRVIGDMHVTTTFVSVTLGTLIGHNLSGGAVTACAGEGFLTVIAGSAFVGGLIGENDGAIHASYAIRDVQENMILTFFGSGISSILAGTLFSSEALSGFATQLTSNIFSLASSTITEIVNLCLGLFISIYLLVSGKKIANIFAKILCALFKKTIASSISLTIRHIYINLCEFFSARLITSFLAGVGCFILSWVFDLPMFSFIAIFLMIAHLFPILGPILSDGIVVLLVLVLNGPQAAFLYLLFLLAVEFLLTKILVPILMRRHLRPSFGLRTAVVLVGGGLFGPIGNLLSIPLYAALRLNFNHLLQSLLRKKELPTSPEDYEGTDMTQPPFSVPKTDSTAVSDESSSSSADPAENASSAEEESVTEEENAESISSNSPNGTEISSVGTDPENDSSSEISK